MQNSDKVELIRTRLEFYRIIITKRVNKYTNTTRGCILMTIVGINEYIIIININVNHETS